MTLVEIWHGSNFGVTPAIVPMLVQAGFRVIVRPTDPATSVARIGPGPHLFILDSTASNHGNEEALHRLRTNHPQTPIIALLNRNAGISGQAAALDAGAKRCLISPFFADEVIRTVNNLIYERGVAA